MFGVARVQREKVYFIVVHLVAAIVLLLWAVRLVRTAVERAYSAQLKRTLAHAERNALSAATVGTGSVSTCENSAWMRST